MIKLILFTAGIVLMAPGIYLIGITHIRMPGDLSPYQQFSTFSFEWLAGAGSMLLGMLLIIKSEG